jgi:hypothetical protein
MTRTLGYADAVRLLAGPQSKAVTVLDQLASGVLRAGLTGSWGLAVSLFDRKAELAELGRGVVAGLGGRLAGLGRFDRSERVRRTSVALSPAQLRDQIEREQLRLALAAFAIANRHRQWATETELNADLATLLDEPPEPPRLG